MSLAATPPPKVATAGRPSPTRIAFWLACALSALVIGTLSQAILFDGDPPEDADLLPKPRPPLAAEVNGIIAMEELAKAAPSNGARLDFNRLRTTWVNGKRTRERVRGDVSEEEFLSRMAEIVELEWREVPRVRNWSLCLEHVQRRGLESLDGVEIKDPIDAALLWIGCERRLFAARESARNLNFAFHSERTAYQVLRSSLARSSAVDLQTMSQTLRGFPDGESALQPVLRRIYSSHRRYLSKREQSRHFKPNRVLASVSGEFREWIDSIHDPWLDRGAVNRRKIRGIGRFLRFLSGNGKGDGWWAIERAQFFEFELSLALVRFDRRATELALALEIYRRLHGGFPEQLEALTPDILETLPLDPFSGEDFLYERERGVVRSVGTDAGIRRGLRREPRDPIDPEDPVVVTADLFPR